MKNIIKAFVIAVVMAFANINVYAQKNEHKRMSREQLAETQAKFIAGEIALDEATAKQFIETYCQFQKDIWALGPRPKKNGMNLSEKETEQAMNERFIHSQKILDLRKKYYQEYSKFLTAKQIEMVYVLERKIMNRLAHRSKKITTPKRPLKN